jgi:ABC-type antimicrobial peptide transport system permease subunit
MEGFMIKNYFKIAWRNLTKNKMYSLINIGGLAIGLACCLAIGLFVWDEISYDKFHTNGKNIYRVVEKQNQAGTIYNVAGTPGPLAAALKNDFPEIIETCRIGSNRPAILQYGDITIESDKIFLVDNSFFSLFDFKLEKGNAGSVLLKPDEVVIDENTAERIFGAGWRNLNNLIGQPIKFNNDRILLLAGITKNAPVNSHIQFNILLSCSYDELNTRRYNWDNNNYHTYIQVRPEANTKETGSKLLTYIIKYKPKSAITLSMQPLFEIYLHSSFAFHTDWSKTSDIVYIQIFSAVGLIVLLIAIFNFINLATARAIERAREVGVRKAIGAFRRQLVIQFLGESLLMTILAVLIALMLLQMFLPLMNNITGKSISIPINNPWFELSIASFVILVSLMSGIYPAFYLSGFQPVKVLKGVFDVGSGRLFRRTLVVGQFMFSVILIIGAIVIYKQLAYLQDKNLGFDKSQLLMVKMKNELKTKSMLLKADLQKQPSVANVTATSTNMIDVISSTYGFEWEGKEPDDKFVITEANIDPDFLNTMGMKLAAGRNFDPGIITDSSSAYLINETAAKRMGWTAEQAINKKIKLWEVEGRVIGVVKDFHFRPLTAAIEPFLFYYWPKDDYSRLFVKTNPNKTREAISAIETFYKKYEKQTAPEYEFVDLALENQYRAQQRTGRIVLYFSLLAIFVSCLGLFGLATFSAEQRIKEIGIRKVLGASVTNIATLFSGDFIKLVIVAIVIACPIAWWAANKWLQDFAYRVEIKWWVFGIAAIVALFIALITVSYQSIKTAIANPVKSLRTE